MAILPVPQEKIPDRQPFHPLKSPPPVMDSPQNCLIEKCLQQLVKKELFGRPYSQDFLYDQTRRNCRPSTLRSYFTTLAVFLSYLKRERGRTSLETITREDLSRFSEDEQDRGRQPTTVSIRLRLLY